MRLSQIETARVFGAALTCTMAAGCFGPNEAADTLQQEDGTSAGTKTSGTNDETGSTGGPEAPSDGDTTADPPDGESSDETDGGGASCDAACADDAVCMDGTCECKPGFEGDGETCTVVPDPCSQDPCFQSAECTETTDGFECEPCPPGYEGDGIICEDIDGCAGDPCFDGVVCSDLGAPDEGFECGPCPAGYEGDGILCQDVDGCSGSPCFVGVTCTDVAAPGSGYECGDCPGGYEGDGETCTEIDGCADSPCYVGVVCRDDDPPSDGFSCGSCPQDFDGDGITCERIREVFTDVRTAGSFSGIRFIWSEEVNGNRFCQDQGYDEMTAFTEFCGEDETGYAEWTGVEWDSRRSGSSNSFCFELFDTVTCERTL